MSVLLTSALHLVLAVASQYEDGEASGPYLGDPVGDERKETITGVPIGTGKEKATITIDAPLGGWSMNRMLQVTGRVSDPSINPITLSINGDRYLLRTASGRFSRAFPAAAGKNVVVVHATNVAGTTQAQVTTFANIPPVPLKAILTSDTDDVYTDLHIYEPTDASQKDPSLIDAKQMAHVYWADTNSPTGGTFFLNEQSDSYDQPGYGPYLYIHRAPPKGVYVIAANYWPSGDKAHTQATLNLVTNEGTAKESKRTVKVPLATPGTTRVLAFVMVAESGGAIYVPGTDPPPSGKGWPKNLATAVRQLSTEGSGGD